MLDWFQPEREISIDEQNFERYRGDDPHKPAPKSLMDEKSSPTPSPESDPNLVTWDGPNDPANPQNWSKSRKWVITAICIIMTVNV